MEVQHTFHRGHMTRTIVAVVVRLRLPRSLTTPLLALMRIVPITSLASTGDGLSLKIVAATPATCGDASKETLVKMALVKIVRCITHP
jgi:hypothetical protein